MTEIQKAIRALDTAYHYRDHDDLGNVKKRYIKIEAPLVETIIKALELAQAVEKDLAKGWVMVPSNPTKEMERKMASLRPSYYTETTAAYKSNRAYKAVIAAAPSSHLAELGEVND